MTFNSTEKFPDRNSIHYMNPWLSKFQNIISNEMNILRSNLTGQVIGRVETSEKVTIAKSILNIAQIIRSCLTTGF